MTLSFMAIGKPEPQGSAKAFLPKGWTRPVVTSDNAKNKGWRRTVAGAAQLAISAMGRLDIARPVLFPSQAVRVQLVFFLPRPKALRVDKPHLTRPDLDKLVRSVLDALTGVVYADDGQVVLLQAQKYYGEAGDPGSVVVRVDAE